MKSHLHMRAIAATLTLLLSSVSFHAAQADPKDYEFRLVETAIKQGDVAVIAVTLIDKRSGKPVPDAVIFATRLDMAPDGMETMTSKIEPLPTTDPGTYRFKTSLSMVGGWRLSLGAKVQGETGSVVNKLIFQAVE
jgi:hypothetical protein